MVDIKLKVKLLDQSVHELEVDPVRVVTIYVRYLTL
jgi:hypothetical protein